MSLPKNGNRGTDQTFKQTCAFFFREFPLHTISALLLLLLAGIIESVGAVSVVPLLTTLIGGGQSNPLVVTLEQLFQSVGIAPTLPNMLIVICLSMVLRAMVVLLAYRQVGYMEPEIATRLRFRILDGLLNADWGYYVTQPAGQLTHALSSECYQAGKALRLLAQSLSFLVQAVVYLIVAACFSWQILVAGLVCGGFLLLSLNFLIRIIRNASIRQAQALNTMSDLFTDSLAGAKPLKAMNAGTRFADHIKVQVETFKHAARRSVMGLSVLSAVQEPFITVLLAAGLYVGHVILSIDAAIILTMAFFFQRILTRVSSFQQALQNYGTMEGSLFSLIGKTRAIAEHREMAGGDRQVTFDEAIELEDVHVSYEDKTVLKGFGLRIPMNSITVLCGPSGVGKTTTVDLITGLVRPDAGTVRIDGVDLAEAHMPGWRDRIGYVPQEVFLFNDTIRANITLGRDVDDQAIDDQAIWEALAAAGADTFVRSLDKGLDSMVGEHGRTLSGGQKQRLMIARALIGQPSLLILDESTTGLDKDTEEAILQSVAKLRKRMAVIAISHQMTVTRIADFVVEFSTTAPPATFSTKAEQ